MHKKKYTHPLLAAACASLLLISNTQATTITFDDLIVGETSYLYDGNSDGISDVVFSTTDPFGFNSFGPGVDQLHVDEPGLEGTTSLTPDLRIDLLHGGTDSISFGFATISTFPGVVQVFNEDNDLIGSEVFVGEFFDLDTGEVTTDPFGELDEIAERVSTFPENFVDVPFDGTAAYVTLDFDTTSGGEGEGGRYIIDDFTFIDAGLDTLDIFVGGDPQFPVMPDPFDPENPEFAFELEIIADGLGTLFPIFIDPIIAVGYSYAITGSNVETVLIPTALPNGDDQFSIVINNIAYDLFAGVTFDIFAMTGIVGGVDSFDILGIDTSEGLDPADQLAFNTGLTFSNATTVNILQTPITLDTDAQSVPEPSALALLMAGLGGLLFRRKKRT
jgi:hypothetical protein